MTQRGEKTARRRAFCAILLSWPIVAIAQKAPIPFIGYLGFGSPGERETMVDAFRAGLKEGGYIDGQNVAIEYRWAEGNADRLPRLAADLVKRNVSLIAALGGPRANLAAKEATTSIPIVFLATTDPIKLGLVSSFNRPGGNLTGVVSLASSLDGKRVQLLRELLPGATSIAYLVNPKSAPTQLELSMKEVEAAAAATATQIHVVRAGDVREFETVFSTIKGSRAKAVLVASDTLFTTFRAQLIELADRHRIPASYYRRELAQDGGLMSYGPDSGEVYRQVGLQAARILKGAKPGDLPVVQAAKFELVLNLKTARKLGLNVPTAFLARTDVVIE